MVSMRGGSVRSSITSVLRAVQVVEVRLLPMKIEIKEGLFGSWRIFSREGVVLGSWFSGMQYAYRLEMRE